MFMSIIFLFSFGRFSCIPHSQHVFESGNTNVLLIKHVLLIKNSIKYYFVKSYETKGNKNSERNQISARAITLQLSGIKLIDCEHYSLFEKMKKR